jgi:iron(III) transport system permease protein
VRLTGLDLIALLLSLTLAIPIASVCLSLFSGESTVFMHLAQTVLPEYAANTLMLGASVVIGVLIVGVPAAGHHDVRIRGGAMEAALILPLAAPAYVLAYAYAGSSAYGPVRDIARAHRWETGDYWFRCAPAAARGVDAGVDALSLRYLLPARFVNESASALEAARLLGRGPWACSLRSRPPRPPARARPALAAMNSFADYGTVSYFGVPVHHGIYSAWFSFSDQIAARELAAVLIGFVASCFGRAFAAQARFHETGRRDRRPARYRLSGAKSFAAIIACSLLPLWVSSCRVWC